MFRFIFIITLLCLSCKVQDKPKDALGSIDLCQTNRRLLEIAMEDGFSPPQASRVYTYPHIAFYSSLQSFYPDSLPDLRLAIHHLPILSKTQNDADPYLSSLLCFILTAKSVVFSEHLMEDYFNEILAKAEIRKYNKKIIESSKAQALEHSSIIKDWIKKDNYQFTRTLDRFTSSKLPHEWRETPPDYTQGLEPHWPKLRRLFLDTSLKYNYKALPQYSNSKISEFYRIVEDVYNVANNLSDEQKLIATYWDDNPNVSQHTGHLSHITHKISPPGHWLNIITQIATKENWSIFLTAKALTYSSMVMYDGIIDCWKLKYETKVIRPISFIQENLNQDWKPLIQTPPFPEFTSGHSVVSASSAEVLTQLLGNNYPFIDSTEVLFGHKPREFKSFHDAAMDVSLSRYYGGIHYKHSVLEGNKQGIYIAQQLMNKLNPKK